jgi:CheY-like chemotaxis protein
MHPSPQSEPIRVLLIEDDDDSAEITRRLLVRFGADVLVAGSVADALSAAVKIRPELVLSDIYLPDGNGFELIPRLRDQLRDQLPGLAPFCVATSGVGGAMNDARSGAARFDRFLQKPIEPSLLQALVDDARGRRSAPLSA